MTEREQNVDLGAVRRRLQEHLAELEGAERLAHEGEEEGLEMSSLGRLSRMNAIQNRAVAQEASRRRDMERHRIAAALARLQQGEFGYCVTCGREISPRRLALDPAVPTCIGCAQRGEKRH